MVKIDSANVRFKMIIISDDRSTLNLIDNSIPEGEVLDKYFISNITPSRSIDVRSKR